MHKLVQQSMVLLIALSVVLVPLSSQVLAQAEVKTEEASAGSMTYDLFVMRPLGAAATILGAGVWVLALPFTALGDNVPEASQKLVKDPYHFTINRPLGTW
jgi:O-antigen/teichoic acid export membrane protein